MNPCIEWCGTSSVVYLEVNHLKYLYIYIYTGTNIFNMQWNEH